MKERIEQLDYLKGIFILLMVTFHLALVEETYPVLREAVYTFHMSAFLIISGYLANVEKPLGKFCHDLLRLVVPYVIFESLYILMQYYVGGSLGAHNAISDLSINDFFLRVATQPTGPYWYIHTLAICLVAYWLIYRILRLDGISALAIMGAILYGASIVIEGLDWSNVIYFMMGLVIMRSGKTFMGVITPSWLALVPLVILFWFPENYDHGTLAGVAITVLVISLLLAVYSCCGRAISGTLAYIGRNSLAIVLLSPIFTLATKLVAPYFSFDPSAVCFTVLALAFVVAGCLASAWVADKMHVSLLIFFKKPFYSPYHK